MTDWHLSPKYVAFDAIAPALEPLRRAGRRIVHCHGTFDLVHPGHIVHFEEARALGDVLVVSFTSENYVNKGPGRPFFNDLLRFKSLAALECVDFVIPVPFAAAVEIIAAVRPTFYCKGKEYEEAANDVTGNIHDDVRAVESAGGEIRYVGSVVFSSTGLLNKGFETYGPDVKSFCLGLAAECDSGAFRAAVDGFAKLRVLVIGDLIFDRYTTVAVQGLTSKNRILSARYNSDEMQAGGALAVFRHIRDFAPNTKLIGYAGREPWLDAELEQHLPHECDGLVRSEKFTTVVKQRFIEPQKTGVELSKLFSVNFIDTEHPSGALHDELLAKVEAEIGHYDLVVVMDFGHGVMFRKLREFVQKRAPYLAVNCQTNSNNYGFNILTNRYERADSFSLDNAEMTLAVARRRFDPGEELRLLGKTFSSDYAWLTRGQIETIGQHKDGSEVKVPPFERRVVDTIGAGDAFCSVASLAAASALPLPLATFLGQLAGGQAVRYPGNRDHVSKAALLKAGMTMLSF